MTKSKKVVYQDDEYVIFEDGSGGAIMSDEEIEDAEKFDKLVSGSDDRDMMDTVDSSVEESILQDAETTDNGSIDIQSEE